MSWRIMSSQKAQALPIAVVALAVGALLITPLLLGASTGSKTTTLVGNRAMERAIAWTPESNGQGGA
ncbi:MAG: hypothetical protein WEC75_13905 [Dehalococcoidia bacterium]